MENLIFYCLLLIAAVFHLKGCPIDQLADGPHDVRWRIVSGFETAYTYANKLGCGVEPLVSVSEDLEPILTGLCWLMEIQELITKVHNGSDLQAILEQNVLDSCQWFNFLTQLNDTCEIGYMPRLTQYCLETRLESLYTDIYKPTSDYFSGTVFNQEIPTWLNSCNCTSDDPTHLTDYIFQPCLLD